MKQLLTFVMLGIVVLFSVNTYANESPVTPLLEETKSQTKLDKSFSPGTRLIGTEYAEQVKSDKEKSEAYLKSKDSSIFFRVFGLILTIVGLSRLFYVMVEAVTDCNRKALFLSYIMTWLIGYFFSVVTELQRAIIERDAGLLIQFMWVVLVVTLITQIVSVLLFEVQGHSRLINSRSSVSYHVEALPDGRHRTVQTVSETMVNVIDSQNRITRSSPMPGRELFNEFRSMAETVAVEREQTVAQPEGEPERRGPVTAEKNVVSEQDNGNKGFIRKISLD
ncbi:conserved membrane hypothetical protein [Vibrio jasicida]|uniref:Uncharacterized protein n=1 Tax=Vibrio jasicida TaxID=766224 RepID=A0AAU9QR44_9VIBR|nr:conserved membrane hypothetical protein [Vibrio jasicida]CAH1599388.1 conserved membrane hypothetical protein [Vibrio jasicida]